MAAIYERIQAIDTELSDLHDRQTVLMTERDQCMRQLALTGLEAADVSLDWLDEQYDLAITALGDLDFDEQWVASNVPALEQVKDAIDDETAAWLNQQRTKAEMHRRLVIAPSTQSIGLLGESGSEGLIPRFDMKQNHKGRTIIEWDAWKRFGDRDPLHDNGSKEPVTVDIVLGDTRDPLHPEEPANDYNEFGLVFVNMSLGDQRAALASESAIHAEFGRDLQPVTLGSYVLANAQRRIEGRPLFDLATKTRLVHYPNPSGAETTHFPDLMPLLDSVGPMGLGGYDYKVLHEHPQHGVRRMLHVQPSEG